MASAVQSLLVSNQNQIIKNYNFYLINVTSIAFLPLTHIKIEFLPDWVSLPDSVFSFANGVLVCSF